MNKLLLFFVMAVFSVVQLQGQSSADKAYEKAQELDKSASYDAALQQYAKAKTLFLRDKQYNKFIEVTAKQASLLAYTGENDMAIESLQKGISEYEQANQPANENLALAYKYLGQANLNKDNFSTAIEALKKGLSIRERLIPGDPDLARDYYNIGQACRLNSQFLEAKKAIEEGLAVQKKNPSKKIIAFLYRELSIINNKLAEFTASKDYLDLALEGFIDIYGKNSAQVAGLLFELGNISARLVQSNDDLEDAIDYYEEALTIYKENQAFTDPNYYASLLELGRNHIDLYKVRNSASISDNTEELKKAKGYLEDLLKGLKKNDIQSTFESQANLSLALVYALSGEYEKADQFLKTAKDLIKNQFSSQNLFNVELFLTEAQILTKQEEWTQLKEIYKQAISLLVSSSEEYLAAGIDVNSYDEEKVKSLFVLTDVEATFARLNFKAYSKTKEAKYLKQAQKHSNYFDGVVDVIRIENKTSGAKMVLSDMSIDAYEIAIAVSLALNKKEKAYYYSEKSKGLVLLEAFQNAKTQDLAGLPKETLDQEEQLRLAITDIKQQLNQLRVQGEGKSDRAKELRQQLVTKKKAYSDFVAQLEKQYPEYYNMKYNIQLLTVAQTQELLQEDQALIEYFTGDEHVFVFKITKTGFEVFDIAVKEDLYKLVRNFRASTYDYYLNSVEKNNELYEKYSKEYVEYASTIYTNFLKPAGELPKRLIIVPSGPFANMPFEPLLVEKPQEATSYQTHHYLVKDHIISYNYSATLLGEMINRKHDEKRETFIGFAPEFGTEAASLVRGKRFALAPLNFNTQEIENVRKTLGTGEIFIGQEAIEERFKELGENYQIIHFATHGMANDRDPDFSLLAFTEIPDTLENEFLYVSDLYNMNLNADLVVLSACETGLGKMHKGEGVISLARGFSYAGAKSIFTTLWSVNDQATSTIVESFYEYLKAGKAKDEALFLAKNDFLENGNNMTSHPFLWAPYIFVGDPAPLDIGQPFPWMYVLIGGGLVALLGISLTLIRRGKSRKEEA